jgi:hypothetical protein
MYSNSNPLSNTVQTFIDSEDKNSTNVSPSEEDLINQLHQRDEIDLSIMYIIACKGNVEASDLEKDIPLTYTALSRRLLNLYKDSYLNRIKSVAKDNVKSQPYAYFLRNGITREKVQIVIDNRRINIEEFLTKLKEKYKRVQQDENLYETENQEEIDKNIIDRIQVPDEEDSTTQDYLQNNESMSLKDSELPPPSNARTASIDEVLEILAVMTDKIAELAVTNDKIAELEARIINLEQQISTLQNTETSKDHRQILDNVRSQLKIIGKSSNHNK